MFGRFGKSDNNNGNMGYDNSNLQIQFNNLKSQYENEILRRKYHEKEYGTLKSMTENLCKSILSNKYNYNQLGGNSILKGMDIYKLIEFTSRDSVEQKIEQKQIIDNLMNQNSVYKQIIENLKEQLSQSLLLDNKDVSQDDLSNANIINNTEYSEMNVFEKNNNQFNMNIPQDNQPIQRNEKQHVKLDIFNNVITEKKESHRNEVPVNNMVEKSKPQENYMPTQKPKEDNSPKLDNFFNNFAPNKTSNTSNNNDSNGDNNNNNNNNNNNSNKKKMLNPLLNPTKPEVVEKPKVTPNQDNLPKLTIENVDSYMLAMTPIMWDIVEVIGTFGYATSNEVLDEINKNGEKYKKGLVLNAISSLSKMNIMTSEAISTGFKRFNIVKLSNKGELMFRTQFKKEPIESEIDQIIRDHDNVVHGYTIREAKDIMLNTFNCSSVTMERQKTSIKLPNGKTYIPDIVAVSEVNQKKRKMYLEVELGNTPQGDFNDKCNKMSQVTKYLYFIADTEDTRKKLEQQISLWILNSGGKESVEGVTTYTTTMTQLSKGEWVNVSRY